MASQTSVVLRPNGMAELVPVKTHVCIPGEPVLFLKPQAVVVVGGGLVHGGERDLGGSVGRGEVLLAEYCGPLQMTQARPGDPPRYFISPPTLRRYTPSIGDPVVGTITRAMPSGCYVAIDAAHTAFLDSLGFDGATKSNRPRMRPGDIVYANVCSTTSDGEVEISCKATSGMVAKDWTSREAVFGMLERGTVISVPLQYARTLISPSNAVLAEIGERVPFDACVGMNGRVWIRGHGAGGGTDADRALEDDIEVERTIAVAACIAESQYDVTQEEIHTRVEAYFPKVQ